MIATLRFRGTTPKEGELRLEDDFGSASARGQLERLAGIG
jgi:hypothetical protein